MTGRVYLGPDGRPLPFEDPYEVVDFLRTADILEREEVGAGSTRPDRLVLRQGRIRARAIFRSIEESRERLQLPGGDAYAAFYDRAIFECAAFELAMMLGIDMIPPAVERHIEGEAGTVQLWVENAMTETERIRRELVPPDTAAWRHQQQIMQVFDALVHNADRNSGNSLIDTDWNVWMVDHTRTFQRPRGRIEFTAVTQLPALLWEALRDLDTGEMRQRLSPFLEPLQLQALLRRHGELIEHVTDLIAERGEGAVLVR